MAVVVVVGAHEVLEDLQRSGAAVGCFGQGHAMESGFGVVGSEPGVQREAQ
jgi:hypothetical protein